MTLVMGYTIKLSDPLLIDYNIDTENLEKELFKKLNNMWTR